MFHRWNMALLAFSPPGAGSAMTRRSKIFTLPTLSFFHFAFDN